MREIGGTDYCVRLDNVKRIRDMKDDGYKSLTAREPQLSSYRTSFLIAKEKLFRGIEAIMTLFNKSGTNSW